MERRHHELANDLLASLTWTDGDVDQDLVAQALATAEQAAAERAWDEGYEAAGKVVHPGVNPYRLPKGPTK